ncbi:MAG: methyl-accepting chemotaxis protein [Oleiphilaceae bacterium]|jgi:methyl-accepting chemotaxis protein
MDFLSNISIKNKHLIILCCVILGLVFTTAVTVYEFNRIGQLSNILLIKEQLHSDELTLRKHEKDFLVRKDIKYSERFSESFLIMKDRVIQLKNAMSAQNLPINQADRLLALVTSYETIFQRLVILQKEIGLDSKSGLYGSLRVAVHEIEALAKDAEQYEILFHMLMLRRNEKDFMLRRDEKYLKKFENNYAKFNTALDQLQPLTINEMKNNIARYRSDFNTLTIKEVELGLNVNSGLISELRNTIHQTEASFNSLTEFLNSEITKASENIYTTLGIIIVLILVLLSGLMMIISRAIYRPVQSITEKIHVIAEDLDLTQLVNHISKDEVGILSKSFDALISSLRNTVNQVKDGSIQVAQASEEMSCITKEVGDASEQQQQEIEQAVTAINQMTATIQSIAENANTAASAVKDVTAEIGRGKAVTSDARNEIEQLNTEVEGATHAIEALQKNSESIGDILSTISAIAEQTNLLALNAAIEAARAGEQGRGFAVVADEVRTLASRTQESTESIRENITQFQKGTAEVVETVSRSRDRAQTGIAKVSESSEILDSIYANISNIGDMNTQVATAAKEQGFASEEINRNVVRINELAHVCHEQANQAATASGELAKLGSELQGTVQRFKV